MTLSCGCDFTYAVYSQKWPKANKEHTCCECRKIIVPGEVYCRTSAGEWRSVWTSWKMCEKCQDLYDSMTAMGFCIDIGGLHEAHQEYIDEYAPPKL